VQKIKRIRLEGGQKYESVLLGIVSAEPDYKLSLALNRKFGISLKNNPPVIIQNNLPELSFSRFSDVSGSTDLTYDLISNRTGKNFLLKKLKNIDYIFQIHDPGNEIDISTTINMLRGIDCITAVFKIDPETIKDKNLLFLIR